MKQPDEHRSEEQIRDEFSLCGISRRDLEEALSEQPERFRQDFEDLADG